MVAINGFKESGILAAVDAVVDYRIAGNFRGTKISRFSRILTYPRK